MEEFIHIVTCQIDNKISRWHDRHRGTLHLNMQQYSRLIIH